ncbi:hypothetical protein DEJ45_32760 [Streptomyces venezuelae]|nr:hypothetical protein DEJ45_32760 [Streptomyces venezuelae]
MFWMSGRTGRGRGDGEEVRRRTVLRCETRRSGNDDVVAGITPDHHVDELSCPRGDLNPHAR